MKFALILGIVAVTCTSSALADNSSKVKVTKAKLDTADSEYINEKTYKIEVVPVTATYNRIKTSFEVVKDLPSNTQFLVQLFKAPLKDGKCGDEQIINTFALSLCGEASKYDNQLPDTLLQLKKKKQCLPKQKYQSDDAQGFKFYDLYSDAELKNSCFRTVTQLVSGIRYLYTVELEFVSN